MPLRRLPRRYLTPGRGRPAGRLRVLATGVKNVHAFVVGTLRTRQPAGSGVPGRYNPTRSATFEADGVPITTARAAHLGAGGLTVYSVASLATIA